MSRFKLFVVSLMVLLFVLNGEAQSAMSSTSSLRRNIATIIFCGVGGAVLGISTLSFYSDPQNHVGNITTGLALGLIGGTVYVTTQATEATVAENSTIKELLAKNRNPKPIAGWTWEF